jgi:protein required for attachment to host cells
MPMHYILVADAARARLIAADELFEDAHEVASYVHPNGRARTRELVTDGRTSTQAFPGGPHSATESADAHDEELRKFAHELALRVGETRAAGAYERLVLVAPPKFLGMLREALDKATSRVVVASVDHDYTHAPLPDVMAALKRQLAPTG